MSYLRSLAQRATGEVRTAMPRVTHAFERAAIAPIDDGLERVFAEERPLSSIDDRRAWPAGPSGEARPAPRVERSRMSEPAADVDDRPPSPVADSRRGDVPSPTAARATANPTTGEPSHAPRSTAMPPVAGPIARSIEPSADIVDADADRGPLPRHDPFAPPQPGDALPRIATWRSTGDPAPRESASTSRSAMPSPSRPPVRAIESVAQARPRAATPVPRRIAEDVPPVDVPIARPVRHDRHDRHDHHDDSPIAFDDHAAATSAPLANRSASPDHLAATHRSSAPIAALTTPAPASLRRAPPPPALPTPAPAERTTVHVSIGRVEIRAQPAAAAPRPQRAAPPATIGLDTYLQRRERGASS